MKNRQTLPLRKSSSSTDAAKMKVDRNNKTKSLPGPKWATPAFAQEDGEEDWCKWRRLPKQRRGGSNELMDAACSASPLRVSDSYLLFVPLIRRWGGVALSTSLAAARPLPASGVAHHPTLSSAWGPSGAEPRVECMQCRARAGRGARRTSTTWSGVTVSWPLECARSSRWLCMPASRCWLTCDGADDEVMMTRGWGGDEAMVRC